MAKPCLPVKICQWYADPRPDLVPALRLLLGRESRLPLWLFINYFASLQLNAVPGAKRLFSLRETRVSFERYMQAYDNTTASFQPYLAMHARLVELLAVRPGETVVDLASGTGNLSLRLKRAGARVISVDNSKAAAAIHRRKDAQAEILIHDLNSSADLISLPDGSVDKFDIANAVTYLADRRGLYSLVKRKLKPGGLFVMQVEKVGYNPASILKSHLAAEYESHVREGRQPLTAMSLVYRGFIAKYEDLLITAAETKKLMRGITSGQYVVFSEAQIVSELQANGFDVVGEPETAYAGQAIILRATPRA